MYLGFNLEPTLWADIQGHKINSGEDVIVVVVVVVVEKGNSIVVEIEYEKVL